VKLSRSLWPLLSAIAVGLAPVRAAEPDVPRDVAKVFDRNKGTLHAIYNRALRDDPKLGGKVTFQFTIDVAGTATSCSIVSSALHAPDVEKKMCDKIMLLKFEPQPAEQTVARSVQFFSRVDLPAN